MVTSSSLADLPIVVPTTPSSVAPALEQNRLAVAGSASSDWIPDWDHGEGTDPAALMGCGDVAVPDTFAGVQMTSMVEAELPEETAFPALLRALFPCGSITGAPKHRTMQHIAALETAPRGLYTGSIGWIDATRRGRAWCCGR